MVTVLGGAGGKTGGIPKSELVRITAYGCIYERERGEKVWMDRCRLNYPLRGFYPLDYPHPDPPDRV